MILNYIVCCCILTVAISEIMSSRTIPLSWFMNGNDQFLYTDQNTDASHRNDQEISPTNEHHHGRVQIKVYRGPDSHDEHEDFAPYGFWVKQPADDEHH